MNLNNGLHIIELILIFYLVYRVYTLEDLLIKFISSSSDPEERNLVAGKRKPGKAVYMATPTPKEIEEEEDTMWQKLKGKIINPYN